MYCIYYSRHSLGIDWHFGLLTGIYTDNSQNAHNRSINLSCRLCFYSVYHHHHHHHHPHPHHPTTGLTWCKHTVLQDHVTKSVWRMLSVSESPLKHVFIEIRNNAKEYRRSRWRDVVWYRAFQTRAASATTGNERSHDVSPGGSVLTKMKICEVC